jgi:hypothetical protein
MTSVFQMGILSSFYGETILLLCCAVHFSSLSLPRSKFFTFLLTKLQCVYPRLIFSHRYLVSPLPDMIPCWENFKGALSSLSVFSARAGANFDILVHARVLRELPAPIPPP